MPDRFTQLDYEVRDGSATLTLDRPDKLNAWTPTMHDEFLRAFDLADADDGVRVVIVTGRGRGFCAGADMSGGAATWDPDGPERAGLRARRGSIGGHQREGGAMVTLRMLASTKPIIAAINGPAVGIGASLTLAMDIRIASDQARMGFVFPRRGVVPDAASSWFLPRAVGISRAMEWMATGRIFDAAEALEGGLVSRVVPADALVATVEELAREIAGNTSPISVAVTRRLLWRSLGESTPWGAHRRESQGYALLGGGPDAVEGVQAWRDRRPPIFTSRVSEEFERFADSWLDPPADVT